MFKDNAVLLRVILKANSINKRLMKQRLCRYFLHIKLFIFPFHD